MNDMRIGPLSRGEDRGSETSGPWIWVGNLRSDSGLVKKRVHCLHWTVS